MCLRRNNDVSRAVHAQWVREGTKCVRMYKTMSIENKEVLIYNPEEDTLSETKRFFFTAPYRKNVYTLSHNGLFSNTQRRSSFLFKKKTGWWGDDVEKGIHVYSQKQQMSCFSDCICVPVWCNINDFIGCNTYKSHFVFKDVYFTDNMMSRLRKILEEKNSKK